LNVDQPFARPQPTHRATQTENKRTQISLPRVGFQFTIPMFERAKTVHTLDWATTVIGPRTLRLVFLNKIRPTRLNLLVITL
jgi:hypothetical protein